MLEMTADLMSRIMIIVFAMNWSSDYDKARLEFLEKQHAKYLIFTANDHHFKKDPKNPQPILESRHININFQTLRCFDTLAEYITRGQI